MGNTLCMTKAVGLHDESPEETELSDGPAGNGIISFFPVMFSPGLPCSLRSGNAPARGLS